MLEPLQLYVICVDPERGKYTAFCEGGTPKASGSTPEEAVGRLFMSGAIVDIVVTNVDV